MNPGKILLIAALTLTGFFSEAQNLNSVKIIGQMKDVVRKGQLHGNIFLDTISEKTNLYGLGPVEYLSGEIIILDGKAWKSTVVSDTTMKVEETYDIKAPFFGYANIAGWTEQILPENIRTISQLEQYLDKTSASIQRPFLFRLSGTVEYAKIHIVNLPKGSKVSSPEEAHKGKVSYQLQNESAEIVGFFSTAHKGIFTHHDTFLHMHLITSDHQKMGHLDEVTFKKGIIKLLLPAE